MTKLGARNRLKEQGYINRIIEFAFVEKLQPSEQIQGLGFEQLHLAYAALHG